LLPMNDRYGELVQRLRAAVLGAPGVVDPAVRAAIESRAARAGGRPAAAVDGADDAAVPADLRSFVDRVTERAFDVTDEDVAALRRAGRGEDEIFEVMVAAALGAGAARLERGLAALRGEV
jgi:alkylhydroperoxidase family enzyme